MKICGANEVSQFEGAGITHMISVGDWDDHFDGLRLAEIPEDNHLILKFTDTQHASHADAPTKEKITPLFEWLADDLGPAVRVAGATRNVWNARPLCRGDQ